MSNARNIASIAGEDVLNASNQIVPVYACRAWVNFNGTLDENQLSLTTGENVYIRDAGNVSSVYFNGTGKYTINYTTAMPDENYSVVCSGKGGDDNRYTGLLNTPTTTSCSVYGHYHYDSSLQNMSVMCVAIFR
jgi:hypothetical protein